MNKITTRPFDVSNYLRDEEDVAAYLQVAIEDGDPALLTAVLRDIVLARAKRRRRLDESPETES